MSSHNYKQKKKTKEAQVVAQVYVTVDQVVSEQSCMSFEVPIPSI